MENRDLAATYKGRFNTCLTFKNYGLRQFSQYVSVGNKEHDPDKAKRELMQILHLLEQFQIFTRTGSGGLDFQYFKTICTATTQSLKLCCS